MAVAMTTSERKALASKARKARKAGKCEFFAPSDEAVKAALVAAALRAALANAAFAALVANSKS